ncbi:hypothetical protein [Aequorivita xiaoshiensis]|nr:hypothetical protein [Aequorivita xiaoshiensis]
MRGTRCNRAPAGGAAGFGGSLTLLDINGGLGKSKATIGKSW